MWLNIKKNKNEHGCLDNKIKKWVNICVYMWLKINTIKSD